MVAILLYFALLRRENEDSTTKLEYDIASDVRGLR